MKIRKIKLHKKYSLSIIIVRINEQGDENNMNIMQMMKQAQQMQKKLQDAQTELANTEFTAMAGNGAVTVVCDGQGKFKKITLSKSALNPENPESVDSDSVEMLEDLIVAATNEALRQLEEDSAKSMEALTGGLNLGGGFPF